MQVSHVMLTAALALTALAAKAPLGDRVISAVDEVPYTQRQLETYFLVKESLRGGPSRPGAPVSKQNWSEAVQAFNQDMMIYQEAVRLGGFQPTEDMSSRYFEMVQETLSENKAFRSMALRLGADDEVLRSMLEKVLRIALFRNSKDKQEAISRKRSEVVEEEPGGKDGQWLETLKTRTVVRLFKEADVYWRIDPTPATGGSQE